MSRRFPLRHCWWLVGLLLAGCHEAVRENPFDPELTPPVELEVALDEPSGTATLGWTEYAGEAEFAAYLVLRNVAKSTEVDTLARIAEVGQTGFADSLLVPDTAYEYRVAVVNGSGLEVASARAGVEGYGVNAVALLPLVSDPASGVLRLIWNRYRDPGFERYLVQRRAVGSEETEELGSFTGVGDTTFADGTPRADVDYVYTVVVRAADRTLVSNAREGRLTLPPVRLAEPVFDSATASVALSWSEYSGPRFAAYRMLRRTEGQVPQTVAEFAERGRVGFVDSGLVGNTGYFYQVVVETERGEVVAGNEVGGRFHRLVDSWPLELEPGDRVRLYLEGEERLTALVAGPRRVRVLFFDLEGGLVGEQVLLTNLFDPPFHEWSPPQAVATLVTPEGERLLSLLSAGGDRVGLLAFGEDGQPIMREETLFAGDFLGLPEYDRLSVRLSVFNPVRTITGPAGNVGFSDAAVAFDRVRVWEGGESLPVLEEDFSDHADGLSRYSTGSAQSNALATIRSFPFNSNGSGRRFRVETELVINVGGGGVVFDEYFGFSTRRLAFVLESGSESAQFVKRAYDEGAVIRDEDGDSVPFPVFGGVPYTLGIEIDEDRFSAFVRSPVRWSQTLERPTDWASLALVEGSVVLTAGERVFLLSPNGEVVEKPALPEAVGETRLWEVEARSGVKQVLGMCLPARHQILSGNSGINRTTGKLRWPFETVTFAQLFGSGVGQGQGQLLMPLSFAVGADGRLFVLDAGNGRVQVFDAEGEYLTEWGQRGSEAGSFDFGAGLGPEDFSGSIVVDGEGYIYVVDAENGRIKKFAR
jgi:hypothetical protein